MIEIYPTMSYSERKAATTALLVWFKRLLPTSDRMKIYTRKEFAREMGITKPTYASFIRHENAMSYASLMKVAEFLKREEAHQSRFPEEGNE